MIAKWPHPWAELQPFASRTNTQLRSNNAIMVRAWACSAANSWFRRCVKAQSSDTTGRSRQLLLAAMSPGLKTHLIVTQLYEFFKDKQLVKTKLLESESLFYLPAHMDLTFTPTVGATVVIFCTTCKYTRISNDSESCVMTVLRL